MDRLLLQAFCSSITGMLATLAILKGVGVGDESATPLAAALTWMFKGMCRHTEWHRWNMLACADTRSGLARWIMLA